MSTESVITQGGPCGVLVASYRLQAIGYKFPRFHIIDRHWSLVMVNRHASFVKTSTIQQAFGCPEQSTDLRGSQATMEASYLLRDGGMDTEEADRRHLVLVVEDEPDNREIMRTVIEDVLGLRAVLVSDGE